MHSWKKSIIVKSKPGAFKLGISVCHYCNYVIGQEQNIENEET